MSWAEIKKAVNSDVSTPLNDMLESVMAHKNTQVFEDSGNFIVPDGVTVIFVSAIASGGGGGGGGGGRFTAEAKATSGHTGGTASPTLIGDYLTIPGGGGGSGGGEGFGDYAHRYGGSGGAGGSGAIGGNPGGGGNAIGGPDSNINGANGTFGIGTYENGDVLTSSGTSAGGVQKNLTIHDNIGWYIPYNYGRGGNGGDGGKYNFSGGGGGSGGSGYFVLNVGIKVTPGETIQITIGEPGAGGSGGTTDNGANYYGKDGSAGTKGVVYIRW